jgi:uncharacterized protein
MNPLATSTPPAGRERFSAGRPPRQEGDAFVADWRPTLFLHYRIAPEILGPEVPFALDLYGGQAYLTLVFFRLERLGLAGLGQLGRWLCRPISDHPFLNLRTYVRGEAGAGIQFLAEWIPNRLGLLLGPRTYGLPYRLGRFRHEAIGPREVKGLEVHDPALSATLRLDARTSDEPPLFCARGSLDEFLIERQIAYTCHGGIRRHFSVRHEPWRVRRAQLDLFDPTLAIAMYPWFRFAEFAGAHLSPGVANVGVSRPERR